jgi:hypothetical protein
VPRAQPEDEDDREAGEQLDQMDPRDGQACDGEQDVREEFIDRRTMEPTPVICGGMGDQGRDLSRQRWLQLRGNGISRCDDGR